VDRRVYVALRAEQPTPAQRGLIRGYLPDLAAEHGRQQTEETLVTALVALARPQPGDRVLEPCCGTGEYLAPLVATGATVVALEGAYLLARAAQALHPRVRVLHLDLLNAWYWADDYTAQRGGPDVLAGGGFDLALGTLPRDLVDAWHWADDYAAQRGGPDVLAGGFDLVLGTLPRGPGTLPPPGRLDLDLSERLTALPLAEEIPLAVAYLEVVLRLLKPGGRAALVLPGSINGWWPRLAQDSLGPLTLVAEVLAPGALAPERKREAPRAWLLRREALPGWTTRRAKLPSLDPPLDLRRLLAA
jgi:SAM-dependent methyltransferase